MGVGVERSGVEWVMMLCRSWNGASTDRATCIDPFLRRMSRPRGCADTVRCDKRNVACGLQRARSSLVLCIHHPVRNSKEVLPSLDRPLARVTCCIESGTFSGSGGMKSGSCVGFQALLSVSQCSRSAGFFRRVHDWVRG